MPGGHRGELEQHPPALGLRVAEVPGVVDPGDVEQPLLHTVVEPGAAEHELPQPVDERLAVHERHAFPVADEVEAEPALRVGDASVGNELDEVGDLVLLEIVRADQPDAHGGGGHTLLEVLRAEFEPVTEELDHEIIAGAVIRREHRSQGI